METSTSCDKRLLEALYGHQHKGMDNQMNDQIAMMASLQEKVRDNIQRSIVDLMPPELFESLVQAQLKDFREKILPAMVVEEAKKHCLKAILAEFSKPEWNEKYLGGSGYVASDKMREILKELVPDLVSTMFSSFGQQVVNNIRNNNSSFRIY